MTDPNHKTTRQSDGRFGAGNPGRPVGSRNRSARVAEAFLDDFEANQDEVIQRLRVAHLRTYMAMITHLTPRQVEVAGSDIDGGCHGAEGAGQP